MGALIDKLVVTAVLAGLLVLMYRACDFMWITLKIYGRHRQKQREREGFQRRNLYSESRERNAPLPVLVEEQMSDQGAFLEEEVCAVPKEPSGWQGKPFVPTTVCQERVYRSYEMVIARHSRGNSPFSSVRRKQHREAESEGKKGGEGGSSPSSSSSSSADRGGTHLHQRILVASVIKNEDNFGYGRGLLDYFQTVEMLQYPRHLISVALLVSDEDPYKRMRTAFCERIRLGHFNRGFLIHKDRSVLGLLRENRTDRWLQGPRRQLLARLRNFLLSVALGRQDDAVFWMDADITSLEPDTLSLIVRSKKPIVTVNTAMEGDSLAYSYDMNAWYGYRKRPTCLQRDLAYWNKGFYSDDPLEDFEPGNIENQTFHLSELRERCDADLVRLHSVGGTVLFVQAEVHRDGALFTTNSVVGSEWRQDGFDGLETEGLCHTASFLGYKCWGMPFVTAWHFRDRPFGSGPEAWWADRGTKGGSLCTPPPCPLRFWEMQNLTAAAPAPPPGPIRVPVRKETASQSVS
uniref:Nucleotide-diphospho-sugar transferase domain-containing protein n=1 Tax=Chromera velia CCMP2878 TaxID=1169474 RepID=A0A0G4HL73_9ALVE|eukprot:Cvel_7315.t1-p1 / transcript=Cvel_7315.t1 / gene=Cvel_7315 / organism=Chromera_velia_CCMP2878 / gene_product=Mannan polymerase II complex anp1 subunit, putative / transcript_product=Mannan polymerase II complex anp1 subunit, putative / location=Cvel_scaffold379:35073-39799(-) / protein_length=518 / sequence_SO=supercontig / SO=protein_coding / is_pseudo=false